MSDEFDLGSSTVYTNLHDMLFDIRAFMVQHPEHQLLTVDTMAVPQIGFLAYRPISVEVAN